MAIPQPRETPTNAPMLATWRGSGRLALQRCEACGRAVFYPRSSCPHCHAARLSWFTAEGRGRIVSFSRIHRGLPEVFQTEAPIVLAEIELAEGVLMIARVVTSDPGAIASGQAVQLVAPEDAARYPLPTFRPA
jgi:uncharacterized OB-fold protein